VRSFFFLFAGVIALIPAAGQESTPERAVRKVVADFVESWNRHDPKAHVQLYAEDVDFVTIGGTLHKGRAENEANNVANFSGRYKDAHLVVKSVSVRFLRPDVAVAHLFLENVFGGGAQKITAVLTFILTKHGDQWLIDVAQNTRVSETPTEPPK
jgi:uncharacterized protein (TIGR02246 family)